MSTATATIQTANQDQYDEFLAGIRERFSQLRVSLLNEKTPLFTTDAAGLFSAFLDALPDDRRQHYNCHACRRFVDTFGGLVAIDITGGTHAVVWPKEAPPFFARAVLRIREVVSKARVTGVFLSSEATLGTPITGPWYHMAVELPPALVFRATRLKTAHQAASEKKQDYATLSRGLADFSVDAVKLAEALLKAESLYRGEKLLGVAKWLRELHEARNATKHRLHRENLVWRAVATAPPGWAHIRSTMVGTLLEDIAAGMTFDDVKQRFSAKMNPLQYQRPSAPPSAGNIAQAEKVIAELKASGSLARRFARLDDVTAMWTPTPATAPPEDGSVFGHLLPGNKTSAMEADGGTMTWEKFARKVLPDAAGIEYHVPHRGNFIALVTAEDMDAPPILQWDIDDARNPVSWYVYSGGSAASQWGVSSGWRKVTAITMLPPRWHDPEKLSHHGDGVIMLLDGCVDTCNDSLGLFPECLRSEFHGVRRTIEAHSRHVGLSGHDQASACGMDLRKGQTWSARVRVTKLDGSVWTYKLDRWD